MSPCRLTSFFPIVDVMFRCRDGGQSSKSVPKERFFVPARGGGTCPGSSGQIFHIAVSRFG